jgi:ribokinase
MSGTTGAGGRVIVVGSINLDLVLRLSRLPAPGETVTGGALSRHDGGKGANQAVAAARAGGRVHLIGAVGVTDGADSVAALAAAGVAIDGVLRTRALTGLAAVLVDPVGENQIAVASGANALLSAEQVSQRLDALGLQPDDVVVLSCEVPLPPLQAAAGRAAAAGARLIVNPAPVQPGYGGVLAGAISTPNAAELRALGAELGLPRAAGHHDRLAIALAAHTVAPVIVTLGADGALLAGPDGSSEHYAGHRVEVVDTTGAGDTLTGVLAASLAAGSTLPDSLRRAVAASALTVTAAGARPAMPSAPAIDALLRAG